jgi:F0F1-type ATP synthase membrane subunit b/b'
VAVFLPLATGSVPQEISMGGMKMKIDGNGREVGRDGYPRWVALAIIVLALVALAGVWIGWRASNYAQETRQAVNGDIQAMKQTYDKNIDAVKQGLAEARRTNTDLQDDLSVVTKRLQVTQGELKRAREEAQQLRDEQTQQLAAMDSQVKDQLATKASAEDVKAVSGEVGGVRTDLDATKKDLQMARSEMGTLIAKNHDDIDTLRRLGERDYTEFTIAQKNKPQKVGDITIELRSADPKRNQCNLAVVVNDKRTEKRNRTINEPIFFYAHGAHQPMEIVINQVEKNKVVGYLSVPKAVEQLATSAGGN